MKIKFILITLLSLLSLLSKAQTTDTIKTDIIETDSTVFVKTTQVISVQISSERIRQEIERYKNEKKTLEEKLKQVDAQLAEFNKLLGGVTVSEERIQEKKRKKLEADSKENKKAKKQ